MFKRLRLIVLLAALSVTLGFMSSTYSRYVADANGNIKIESLGEQEVFIERK